MVNGTVTMEVALKALGIGWGDEVIVPALTFAATPYAAMAAGALPVFCDVLPGTLTIDPDQVEAAVTPRTRAIMPVHLGHQMADMDRVAEIARRHSLALVEDCAHAHGQRWRGRGPAPSASSGPSATSRPSSSPPGRVAACSPTTPTWPAGPTR